MLSVPEVESEPELELESEPVPVPRVPMAVACAAWLDNVPAPCTADEEAEPSFSLLPTAAAILPIWDDCVRLAVLVSVPEDSTSALLALLVLVASVATEPVGTAALDAEATEALATAPWDEESELSTKELSFPVATVAVLAVDEAVGLESLLSLPLPEPESEEELPLSLTVSLPTEPLLPELDALSSPELDVLSSPELLFPESPEDEETEVAVGVAACAEDEDCDFSPLISGSNRLLITGMDGRGNGRLMSEGSRSSRRTSPRLRLIKWRLGREEWTMTAENGVERVYGVKESAGCSECDKRTGPETRDGKLSNLCRRRGGRHSRGLIPLLPIQRFQLHSIEPFATTAHAPADLPSTRA